MVQPRKIPIKLKKLTMDVVNMASSPNGIPIKYYSAEPNVGDLLNLFLIPRISGKPVFKSHTHRFNHLAAIGSLIEGVGPKTFVWGAGSINGSGPVRSIDPDKVFALRGVKTLQLLQKEYHIDNDLPLGDPGLLMPLFFNPRSNQDVDVGIIPHHTEKTITTELILRVSKLRECRISVIDVRQNPEDFIKELKRCKFVLSSSLHGLVLADAYGIPNRWIQMSGQLIGQRWKFEDYYSVTVNPRRAPLEVQEIDNLISAALNADRNTAINSYARNIDELLNSFPKELTAEKYLQKQHKASV